MFKMVPVYHSKNTPSHAIGRCETCGRIVFCRAKNPHSGGKIPPAGAAPRRKNIARYPGTNRHNRRGKDAYPPGFLPGNAAAPGQTVPHFCICRRARDTHQALIFSIRRQAVKNGCSANPGPPGHFFRLAGQRKQNRTLCAAPFFPRVFRKAYAICRSSNATGEKNLRQTVRSGEKFARWPAAAWDFFDGCEKHGGFFIRRARRNESLCF